MTILWIDIVTLVLLTTLTGSIMMLLWYGIGMILERLGFINIVFELLKMVALFFYLPIAFIGLNNASVNACTQSPHLCKCSINGSSIKSSFPQQ